MKELRLYKVECIDRIDNLYLDEKGKPFLIQEKSIHYSGRKRKEKTLFFTNPNKVQTSRFLKEIIANTLLENEDKYVWYKDGNPENCTVDNLVLLDEQSWVEKTPTNENSFICKKCGKRIFRKCDNQKKGICANCKADIKAEEKRKCKKQKQKELGKYLDNNREWFRHTKLRNDIIVGLKKGKSFSDIARDLGVSRQCIDISVKGALDRIDKREKILNKKEKNKLSFKELMKLSINAN